MTRCILYEWIVKAFKLKKCLNCRFYACGACTWSRTACQMSKFHSCYRFSLEGYYERYKEFLENAINFYDKYGFDALNKHIQRVSSKYKINYYLVQTLSSIPNGIRIWFKMEGINHFCHFTKDWYELDANVILNIDKKRRRN